MSDLLKEIISYIGVEFLLENNVEVVNQENNIMEPIEKKVFPDFDHITVI
jgi:hypothetical protein